MRISVTAAALVFTVATVLYAAPSSALYSAPEFSIDWNVCDVCEVLVDELGKKLAETAGRRGIIETGNRLDTKGNMKANKVIKETESEVRLIESMEDICDRLYDYQVAYGNMNGKNLVLKDGGRDEEEALLFEDGGYHQGASLHEMFMSIRASIIDQYGEMTDDKNMLKTSCEAILDEHEDDVFDWFKEKQGEVSLKKYLCVQKLHPDTECDYEDAPRERVPEVELSDEEAKARREKEKEEARLERERLREENEREREARMKAKLQAEAMKQYKEEMRLQDEAEKAYRDAELAQFREEQEVLKAEQEIEEETRKLQEQEEELRRQQEELEKQQHFLEELEKAQQEEEPGSPGYWLYTLKGWEQTLDDIISIYQLELYQGSENNEESENHAEIAYLIKQSFTSIRDKTIAALERIDNTGHVIQEEVEEDDEEEEEVAEPEPEPERTEEDLSQILMRLTRMRNAGALSLDEFQRAKDKLLL